jgi:hypothetical protein
MASPMTTHPSDPAFPPSTVPPRPDRPVPGRRRGRSLVAVLCAVIALALVMSAVLGGGLVKIRVVERGTPRAGASVGAPSRVAAGSDPRASEFSFLHEKHGEPARWDPCEPIDYVVNLQGAPDGSMETLRRAIRRVQGPTHLRFRFDGFTSEDPEAARPLVERARYGPGWAPVLISWASPGSPGGDLLGPSSHGTTLGVTYPRAWPVRGGRTEALVSAMVVLNDALPLPGGFGQPNARGLVMQHELGHVVGLGHVPAQGEIMNPRGGGALNWGPGDLAGLRRLGRSAGCFRPPTPPF